MPLFFFFSLLLFIIHLHGHIFEDEVCQEADHAVTDGHHEGVADGGLRDLLQQQGLHNSENNMTGAEAEQDVPAIVKQMVPGVSEAELHAAANGFCNDNGKNEKVDRFQST